MLTPLFYENPTLILPNPQPFLNFVQSFTSLCFPITSNPHSHPHYSFRYPVSLAEWVIMPYLILLHDNMDLHMSSLGTLVPQGPWSVFHAKRCQVYWGLIGNVVFYWYSDLISHTHTRKHTQHTQGPVDWHTHININLHNLLCAHSCYLYMKWLNE